MSPSGFRFFVCADVFSFHIVTPQKFEIALRQAKAFADAHPKQVPLTTLNAERSTLNGQVGEACRFGFFSRGRASAPVPPRAGSRKSGG